MLPDDLLLCVFLFIFESIHDVTRLMRVCSSWSKLIRYSPGALDCLPASSLTFFKISLNWATVRLPTWDHVHRIPLNAVPYIRKLVVTSALTFDPLVFSSRGPTAERSYECLVKECGKSYIESGGLVKHGLRQHPPAAWHVQPTRAKRKASDLAIDHSDSEANRAKLPFLPWPPSRKRTDQPRSSTATATATDQEDWSGRYADWTRLRELSIPRAKFPRSLPSSLSGLQSVQFQSIDSDSCSTPATHPSIRTAVFDYIGDGSPLGRLPNMTTLFYNYSASIGYLQGLQHLQYLHLGQLESTEPLRTMPFWGKLTYLFVNEQFNRKWYRDLPPLTSLALRLSSGVESYSSDAGPVSSVRNLCIVIEGITERTMRPLCEFLWSLLSNVLPECTSINLSTKGAITASSRHFVNTFRTEFPLRQFTTSPIMTWFRTTVLPLSSQSNK